MTIANAEGTEVAPAVASRQMRNAIVASVLGWSLDLFDLFILLYVAPVVGALFFPSTVPTLSLAAVYASFAVTLLMRPVGSAIFGHYADVHGRKNAMFVAIVGVGISTAAFGLLPTIAQAGVVAPVLFLILRLVQGIFVGGVVASTHTIGTEWAAPNRRGAMSGLVGGGGAGIGALLASFVFLVMSSIFPGDLFAVWGWRCMFFSGLLSSLLGWFIFNNLEESPFFKEQEKRKAAGTVTAMRSPVKLVFSSQYRNVLLLNLLITFGGGAGYYLTSGYLPSFLKVVKWYSQQRLVADPDGRERGCIDFGGVVRRRQRCDRPQEDVSAGWGLHAGSAADLLSRPRQGHRYVSHYTLCAGDRLSRQCRLRADSYFSQRAISDRDPRQRYRTVLEYRVCAGRHDADLRVAMASASPARIPDIAVRSSWP